MDDTTSLEKQNNSLMLAENFLKQIADQEDDNLLVSKYDGLNAEAIIIVRDNLNLFPERHLERRPYKKSPLFYDKVIKSNFTQNAGLINAISNLCYADATELLTCIFNEAKDENSCGAAAIGLSKTSEGLQILKRVLKNGPSTQQESAIWAILRNAANPNTKLMTEYTEIFKANRTHENPNVREQCLIGLSVSHSLIPEYLKDAIKDEDEKVRYRIVLIIDYIDANIAKEYATLLEDKKGYIVNQIFKNFEKNMVRVDEGAFSKAIIRELVIRESGQPSEYFNTEITANALNYLFTLNARLHGETLKSLCDISFNNKGGIRRRAVLTAVSLDERGFLAQINENAEQNPDSARDILYLVSGNLDANIIAKQISETDPSNVQQNAANQIKLLSQYHENGLQQAKTSFNWALGISIAGFPFLLLAIYYLFTNQTQNPIGIISAIASALVQLIAGTLLYLYNQTRKQLTYYHKQMNQTQKFLLANSVAESLDQPAKEKARLELINIIASTKIKEEDIASE
jgi:hypothetical protein